MVSGSNDATSDVEARPVDGAHYSVKDILALIREDLAYRRAFEARRPGWLSDIVLLLSAPGACVLRFRLQCLCFSLGLAPIGRIFKFVNLLLYGIEIDERARIGGGFVIGHPNSIVITDDVMIGRRCLVYHHTTISRSPFCEPGREPGPVRVGDDVIFGMGSYAGGNIAIGDGCQIGANTVVERSLPAGSRVLGIPARLVEPPREA